MTKLFSKLLKDELNELSYDAELAGLSYSVYNTQAGVVVSVAGYSHKLLVLLDEVLRRVAHFKVKEERLALIKARGNKRRLNGGRITTHPSQWVLAHRRRL